MARRVLTLPAAAALTLAAALGAPFAAVAKDGPYQRGETIEITGTVVDAAGTPVEGVTVVLLASHRGFELKSMRREEKGLVRAPASTDARGGFAIEWRWDPYFDTFRIRAEGVTAAGAGAGDGDAQPGVLAEVDLTRRVEQGSPVVVALEVADAGPHRQDRALEAAPQSDDQRRVYEQMGKPDRVDRLELSGGDEVTWWYFEGGRSFHFRGGRLDQVMEFEPVKGF